MTEGALFSVLFSALSLSFGAMALALVIDAAVGWPDALYRRIGHPVTWIGALIARLDGAWNRPERSETARRRLGLAACLVVVAAAVVPTALIQMLLPGGVLGMALTALLAAPLVAARSLWEHVAAVARPLAAGDGVGARRAVSMIVGRDPNQLDDAGVARAAIESLAENASDGVVAPLLWGALFGLPGIAAYKAINTLDSMIGHRTPRHEAFGAASARLDDGVNWIPARLTGHAIAAASPAPTKARRVMRRDARRHRSPNAGWPEAATAGGLGFRLSGPRVYADRVAQEPWLNEGAPDPVARDVGRALAVTRRAFALVGLALAVFALLFALIERGAA